MGTYDESPRNRVRVIDDEIDAKVNMRLNPQRTKADIKRSV